MPLNSRTTNTQCERILESKSSHTHDTISENMNNVGPSRGIERGWLDNRFDKDKDRMHNKLIKLQVQLNYRKLPVYSQGFNIMLDKW